MEVVLMDYTKDADWLAMIAGKTCYSELPMHEICAKEKDAEKWIADKIARGHLSILEHVKFTFSVSGVSRALTHQLVRHRLASYSQQSQRYVDMANAKFVVPPEILATKDDPLSVHTAYDKYMEFLDYAQRTYDDLVKAGIMGEDARYVLPNATCTNIVVTMNARELRHFLELRMCNHAQWEIREMAKLMYAKAREVAPGVMQGAGPKCENCGSECKLPFNG